MLSSIKNSNLAIVARVSPGTSDAIRTYDSTYDPNNPSYAGITTFYAAPQLTQDEQQQANTVFRTEIVSEVGGDYLGARLNTTTDDQIHYFSTGLNPPAASSNVGGLKNFADDEAYLHKLVDAGWDGMAAGGFASLGAEQDRLTLSTKDAVSTINTIVGFLVPAYKNHEALTQEQAAAVRNLQAMAMGVAGPSFLVQNAGAGFLGEISPGMLQTIGTIAVGVAAVAAVLDTTTKGMVTNEALAALGTVIGMQEWHIATDYNNPNDGLLNTDTTMEFAVGNTGAPSDIPDGTTRMWGRTADGKMVVQDTDNLTAGTHQYIRFGNTSFQVISEPGQSYVELDNPTSGRVNQMSFDAMGNMVLTSRGTDSVSTTPLGPGFDWTIDQNGSLIVTRPYNGQTMEQASLNSDGSFTVIQDPLGLLPLPGEARVDAAFGDVLGHGIETSYHDANGHLTRVVSQYVDTNLVSVSTILPDGSASLVYNRLTTDAGGVPTITHPVSLDRQGNAIYQQDDGTLVTWNAQQMMERTMSALPLPSSGDYQYGDGNGNTFSLTHTYGAGHLLQNTIITTVLGTQTTVKTIGVDQVVTTKVTDSSDGSMSYTVDDPNGGGASSTIHQSQDGSRMSYSTSLVAGISTSIQESWSPSGDIAYRIVETGWLDQNGDNQATEDVHSEQNGTVMDSHWSSLDQRTLSKTVDASGVVTVSDNVRLPNNTLVGTTTVTYPDDSQSVDVFPGPSGQTGTHVKTTTLVDGTVTVEDYQAFNPNGIHLVSRTTTSPSGGQDQFLYDQGTLVSETAHGLPWGEKVLTFYSDGATQTSDITDVKGNHTTASYDLNGNITASSYRLIDGAYGSFDTYPGGDFAREDHLPDGSFTLSSQLKGVSTSEVRAADTSYVRTVTGTDGVKSVETHAIDGAYTLDTSTSNGMPLMDGNTTESYSYDTHGTLVASSYTTMGGAHGSYSLVDGVTTHDDVTMMGAETKRIDYPNGQAHVEQHHLIGMYTDVVQDIYSDETVTTSTSQYGPSRQVDEEWANGDHTITTTQMDGSTTIDRKTGDLVSHETLGGFGWEADHLTEQDSQHTLDTIVYRDGSLQRTETRNDGWSETYSQDATGVNYHDLIRQVDGSTRDLTVTAQSQTLTTVANGVHDTQVHNASGVLTAHTQQWDSTGEVLSETFGANGAFSRDDRLADGSETHTARQVDVMGVGTSTTETWNAGRTVYASEVDGDDGTVTTTGMDSLAGTWHQETTGLNGYTMVDDKPGDGSETRTTHFADPMSGITHDTFETWDSARVVYHSDMVGSDGSSDSLVVNNLTGESHEEVHNASAWYLLDRASYNDPYVVTPKTTPTP